MTKYCNTQRKKDIELARYNGAYQAANRFYFTHWRDCRNNGITRQYVLDLCNYYASNINCYRNNYNVLQRTKYIRWAVYGRVARDLRKEFAKFKEPAFEELNDLARTHDKQAYYKELHKELRAFADRDILPPIQKRILKFILETNEFNIEKISEKLKIRNKVVNYNRREILHTLAEYFRCKYPGLIEGDELNLAYAPTIDKKELWERKTKAYFDKVLTEPLFINEFIKYHGKKGIKKAVLNSMIKRGEILVVRKRNAANALCKAYVLKKYYKRGKKNVSSRQS